MIGPPVQVAYAVVDAVTGAKRWASRGVGPFFVIEHIDVRHVRVRGVPGVFDHSSAYAQWGQVMIELICQHDGGTEPVVRSSGLHHVAHFVDDFSAASAELDRAGHAEVLQAQTAAGMPFAFHDGGPERGHLIEIYERTERLAGFYDMVRDASIDWDGTDPVRTIG